jgi:hypothetical protein
MSMVPVATITVAMDQNVPVVTMVYPLVAIVLFCSSVPSLPLQKQHIPITLMDCTKSVWFQVVTTHFTLSIIYKISK